jgi:5-methylcytosine-specific restriction endonuclease McrA
MKFDQEKFTADVAQLGKEDLEKWFFETLLKLSLILNESDMRVRVKPIFSPSFGYGRYSLASRWAIEDGLDVVSYYVIDTRTRYAVSCATNKADALAAARSIVKSYSERIQAEASDFMKHLEMQRAQEHEARMSKVREAPKVIPGKRISRRRRQIFDEAQGKCHYCQTVLTLDGKWHVEHKMPKALGGGNEPGNLVASCAPCNHQKRDKTDLEFIASRKKLDSPNPKEIA